MEIDMDWTQYYSGEPDPQIYRDILANEPSGKGAEWLMKYDLLQQQLAEQDRLATQKLAAEYMGKTAAGEWQHPGIINLLSQTDYPGSPGFNAALNRYAQNVRALGPDTARDVQWQRNEQFPANLTPGDLAEQRLLAQIQNDYTAMAGQPATSPGAGYLTESPESARRNALQNLWGEEWNKRIGTSNYDPRFAQNATSFSPQFGGVYVDPFQQEGPMGALRDRGFQMRPRPTKEYTRTGQEIQQGAPRSIMGQWIQPAAQVPELPEGATAKGVSKYFQERDKQQQTYLDEEMKQRRVQAQKLAEETRKRQIKTEDTYKRTLLSVLKDPMFQDPKTKGLNAEGMRSLLLTARIHNTQDWQEAMRLAQNDPDVASAIFTHNLRIEHEPGFRQAQAQLQEAEKKTEEKQEQNQKRIDRMLKQYYSATPLEPEPRKPTQITPASQRWKFTWKGPKYSKGQEPWPANALPDFLNLLTPTPVKMPWDNLL